MINVKIGKLFYEIEGHANYDNSGKDIVCSAVSALAQSTLIGLHEFSHITHHIEDGFICVHIHANNKYTQALMFSLSEGLKNIENDYPEYINVEREVIDEN